MKNQRIMAGLQKDLRECEKWLEKEIEASKKETEPNYDSVNRAKRLVNVYKRLIELCSKV